MSHFVYVIYSSSRDRYYVGETQDLDNRLSDHRNSRSNYTKGTSDWELKWFKELANRSEARELENQIKRKKSRKYIEYLISSVD